MIPIAIDSGAHALYNEASKKWDPQGPARTAGDKAIRATFTQVLDSKTYRTPEFTKYLESYIRFLKKYQHRFAFCASLDIIYNGKASYEVWKEIQATGLQVMPVFHYGEDLRWLKKYLAETDYIGIGGLGQYVYKNMFVAFADDLFRKVLTDSKGRPIARTHGFAMTSLPLLTRYPWTTVDSTAAFMWARLGAVAIPWIHKRNGKWEFDYLRKLLHLAITKGRRDAGWHFAKQPEYIREGLTALFDEVGVNEDDLAHEYAARDYFNVVVFNRLFEALSEKRGYHATYYLSGNPSAGPSTVVSTMKILKELGRTDHIGYLGTYWQLTATDRLMKALHNESLRPQRNPEPLQRKLAKR